jgi:ribosomal protein L11 methylase PrmA
VLLQHHPTRVLDIGCNTGTFSALAARHGSEVVAIDSDISALDRAAEISIAEKLNILTLAVDLDRPTPAAGWDNSETLSFLERAAGHFDLVMMLAVIHHLLLQAQVPLDRIASLAHSLTRRHLLVEWVPQTDPMWQQILRGRDSIYAHLTEEAFLNAFSPGFLFISCKRLSNGRSLHLLERR